MQDNLPRRQHAPQKTDSKTTCPIFRIQLASNYKTNCPTLKIPCPKIQEIKCICETPCPRKGLFLDSFGAIGKC